ncbi:MAG: hypothetical protein HYY52_05070 [Candidatus Melainabacteria bacterium]|nr:hypothetical protein [Candidatus Melainabacteria bacterium]
MIRNYKKYKEFEDSLIANEKADFEKNQKLYEWMYNEAVQLKVIPLKNPLEGIDTDIRIAKLLNSVSKPPKKASY